MRKNAAEISELEASVKLRKAEETSSNAKISEALDRIKTLEAEKARVQRDCDAIEQEYIPTYSNSLSTHLVIPACAAGLLKPW